MKKISAVFALSLLVAACGDKTAVTTVPAAPTGIEGSYQMENGKANLTFSKSGEVTYSHPNFASKTTNYKLQDQEIEFQFNEGYLMKIKVLDEQHLKSNVGDLYVKQ